MSIQNQLRSGAAFPNLDVQVELNLDLTAKRYRVVMIQASLLGYPPASVLSPPMLVAGILQNAPKASEVAIVRIFGWTNVVYGDTIAVGDLLKPEESGAYDRLVPFVMGTDGHNHAANHTAMESCLFGVTDLLTQAGVPSLVSPTHLVAKQWYSVGGVLTEHTSSTTVSECGGSGAGDGWYMVSTTSVAYLGYPHRLTLEAVSESHNVSPQDHQWVPRASTDGPPVGLSYRFLMGHALSEGVADDIGLMILRPQLW